MTQIHKYITLFFIALISVSCTSTGENIKINNLNGIWEKNEVQKFDFSINDTQNPQNIIFIVRNNNKYPYSNVRFIVNLTDPKKKTTTDTLNYILAHPNGEWIGKGFGDTKETLFQYKMNYKFPKSGLYEISILQAMRKDTLMGIEDIGVLIEPVKP